MFKNAKLLVIIIFLLLPIEGWSQIVVSREYSWGHQAVKDVIARDINNLSNLDYAFAMDEIDELQEINPGLTEQIHGKIFASLFYEVDTITYWQFLDYLGTWVFMIRLEPRGFNKKFDRDGLLMQEKNIFGRDGSLILAKDQTSKSVGKVRITEGKIDWLDSLIFHTGFSDVVGEGQLMNIMVISTYQTLDAIEQNPVLVERYERWRAQLSHPANALNYSKDYPAAIHARKLNFLINTLKEIDHPLADPTREALEKIEIIEADL